MVESPYLFQWSYVKCGEKLIRNQCSDLVNLCLIQWPLIISRLSFSVNVDFYDITLINGIYDDEKLKIVNSYYIEKARGRMKGFDIRKGGFGGGRRGLKPAVGAEWAEPRTTR